MFSVNRALRWRLAGLVLLWVLHIGTAVEAVPAPSDPAKLLREADSTKTSNHAEFTELLQRLGDGAIKLSAEQSLNLRYLMAWDIGYQGDYGRALSLIDTIISESGDATLRFRARATAVNILTNLSRYQEAYERLSQLLSQLPQVADKDAREQGLAVAAYLYGEAGQYDLASGYADKVLEESPVNSEYACKGWYMKLAALYRGGKLQSFQKQLDAGIDTCSRAGDVLFANLIRFYVASLQIQQGHSADAIKLLQENYAGAVKTSYPSLISQFDASLAQAYWNEGDLVAAKQFALAAVSSNIKREYIESLVTAYRLLYLIAQHQGDPESALAYHVKYMAADKGYLDDVSAKALAYQVVSQQLLAKKLQIDTLNKQNQILTLQQTLTKKQAETSRLYIVLLLIVLASIALWTYKIKRSQLRFMKLARRDGLTGIFNRQYFVDEAEQLLQYCRRSSRIACLVLIDLDHFKAVNDTHGHAVGDRVLKRAVAVCEAHLRSTDIFGRLGGEEFGIVLPECTLDQVISRVELIRVAIATASGGDDALGIPISASFGVSTTAHSGWDLRQLLAHADDALYRSKREGRNRVSVSDSSEPCLKTG